MRELNVRVGQNGILRVGSNGYSVPSGLKGKRVTARIYEWHIEVWYANQRIETLPRVPGAHHYQINYRHVIDSLLRKPGGFRNYRYRDDLFPREVFRQAWDVLNQHLPPRRADLTYLRDPQTSRSRIGSGGRSGAEPAARTRKVKPTGMKKPLPN